LIIAQRLSTIRDANLIVVLDRGGTSSAGQDQLLAHAGLYAWLWRAQARQTVGCVGRPSRFQEWATRLFTAQALMRMRARTNRSPTGHRSGIERRTAQRLPLDPDKDAPRIVMTAHTLSPSRRRRIPPLHQAGDLMPAVQESRRLKSCTAN
jgi:hypothetical protein